MDRFAVRSEGQKVIVDTSKLYRSDTQKKEWDAAFVSMEEKIVRCLVLISSIPRLPSGNGFPGGNLGNEHRHVQSPAGGSQRLGRSCRRYETCLRNPFS
jgi:hypothetical protein